MTKPRKYAIVLSVLILLIIISGIILSDKISDRIVLNKTVSGIDKIINYDLPDEATGEIAVFANDHGKYSITKTGVVDGETAYHGLRKQGQYFFDEVYFTHDCWSFSIYLESDSQVNDYQRQAFNEFIDSISFK